MKLAIGQYIPSNSIIHKMDPRIKIFTNILFIVMIFLARSFITSFIVFLPILLTFFLAKLQPRKLFSLLKPALFLLVFLFIINIFVLRDKNPSNIYWKWWLIQISYLAIKQSLMIFIRVYSMIVITTILISSTKPLDLTRGIEDLMYPLKWIKFPVHIIAMIISIALRFIPTLLTETNRIMQAQASRGVDFYNGSIKAKFKSTITLIIPLFVLAFAKAEDLSNAMETRGYDPYATRTRYRKYIPKFFDYIALIFVITLFIIIMIIHFSSLIYLGLWWV